MKSTAVFVGSLIFALLALPVFSQCPEGAISAQAIVSVSIRRGHDQPNRFMSDLKLGEQVRVTVLLTRYPVDVINGTPGASVYGGSIELTVGGRTWDVTPTGGIGVIGEPACGGVDWVLARPLLYTVGPADVAAGRILAGARYAGTAWLAIPQAVSASGFAVARTQP